MAARLFALTFFFVASFAHAGSAIIAPTNPWIEQPAHGDAGPRTAPQNLTGGPYDGFRGIIGDPTPPSGFDRFDAFRFSWGGGVLSVSYGFSSGIGSVFLTAIGAADVLSVRLFTDALVQEIAPVTEFFGFESWGFQPGGNYIMEFEATVDPDFVALTSGPIGAPTRIAAVPEPGLLALMLAGFAGLVVMRRRAPA